MFLWKAVLSTSKRETQMTGLVTKLLNYKKKSLKPYLPNCSLEIFFQIFLNFPMFAGHNACHWIEPLQFKQRHLLDAKSQVIRELVSKQRDALVWYLTNFPQSTKLPGMGTSLHRGLGKVRQWGRGAGHTLT